MNSERLEFKNASGETLSARLELPIDNVPRAYAIFAHCFTCSKNIRAATYISRALAAEGVATLRFDFTGLGESEGDFSDTNFSSNVDDLVAAAEFLDNEYDAPQVLVGHSLGGAAVIQAAQRIPSSVAVVTIGAPCDPAHLTHIFDHARPELEEKGEAAVTLAGRKFTIRQQFIDDLEMTRMQEVLGRLGRALLVLHSPTDEIVGIENAGFIFQAAQHPKSFVSLDGMDHLVSDEGHSRYVGSLIASWVGRYLSTETPVGGSVDEGWTIARTGEARYYTEIKSNGHILTADEPVEVGGTDLGPSPYGLLASALGACTSITLRMYADRKKWPLEGITVRLRHEKIHARDCEDCETKEGRVDRITREIELQGALDAEQRQRLREIADRCPVHRTLHSEVNVQTILKES